jgi:hypothetical protein
MPALVAVSGCAASFQTTQRGPTLPGLFPDGDIAGILARKPMAAFPVDLAIVRVQEPNYYTATARGYGAGRFSVVNVRDVEKDEDFKRIADAPQIDNVVTLNRLLLSDHLDSDVQFRQAAASLHAGIVLIYTFDTQTTVNDAMRPLSVISLGLSPNQNARVTSTASAVLIDVASGYVYGACETTATTTRLASAWTSDDTVERARLATEREAVTQLLVDFDELWQRIVSERENESATAPTS